MTSKAICFAKTDAKNRTCFIGKDIRTVIIQFITIVKYTFDNSNIYSYILNKKLFWYRAR